MGLYVVFVRDSFPKSVAYRRLNFGGKATPTSEEIETRVSHIIGDSRPFLLLACDYPEDLPDKLREAGFDNELDFINNFSKVIDDV